MRDLYRWINVCWSAPHVVCATTRSRFNAFVYLSFRCRVWGKNKSLRSNMMPRKLVSSTAGMADPFRIRTGSWWSLWSKNVYILFYKKKIWSHWCRPNPFKHCWICLSMMWIYLERQQIKKSSTHREYSTPGEMALTTELIFKLNRVTERILPCGTPISWS